MASQLICFLVLPEVALCIWKRPACLASIAGLREGLMMSNVSAFKEMFNMSMLAHAAPSKDVCAARKHALRASMAVQ